MNWQIIIAERPVPFGDTRLPERFWNKVVPEPMSGCWLWSGAERNGYARIWLHGAMRSATRWAFSLLGQNSDGLVVMHKCDTPACVNFDHLRLATQDENVADRDDKGHQAQSRRTHCPRGHAYSEFGVVRGGKRYCRPCLNINAAAHRARKTANHGRV